MTVKCLPAFCTLLMLAGSLQAERYQVVEDRFGNLDAELSSQGSTQPAPLPNPPAEELSNQGSVSEVQETQQEGTLESEPAALTTDVETPADQTRPGQSAQANSPDEQAAPEEVRKLGKFERIFLENEGLNPYDATSINPQDFVDAEALLEGRAETPSSQPFFITRDPDGNENITFYSPSLAQEAKRLRETKLAYSKATIYRSGDKDGIYIGELPEQADPLAIQILSAGKGRFENYFTTFARGCCAELPKTGVKIVEFGRSEHLRILESELPYRFNEGDSRYLIFRLPESKDNFAIQLRAFIKPYQEQDVEFGVFYPQVVMLDINLQPLRIIANPVLEYTPESWSNYGFLEGVFEVDRTENLEEEYVLINTTRDALKKVSEFDHEEGRIVIRHMKFGELGVKAVEASELIQP